MNSLKFRYLIFFYIFLVILGILVVSFLYTNVSRVNPDSNSDNWKLYNHPYFTFNYPSSWRVSEEVLNGVREVRFSSDGETPLKLYIHNNYPRVSYNTIDQFLADTGREAAHDITLGRYPAKYFIRQDNTNNNNEEVISFVPDNTLIIILKYSSEFDPQANETTFDRILTTFRFIDPEAG